MTEGVPAASVARIAVIAADVLRAVGISSILADTERWQVETLSWSALPQAGDFDLLLLDHSTLDWLIEALQRVRRDRPQARVVLMCPVLPSESIQQIIALGAKGFLPSTAREQEIVMAVEIVLDGSLWAPRKVLARLIDAQQEGQADRANGEALSGRLTQKESAVLELLMQGRSNREIGREMGIEEVTVKAHLGRMLRKAGVKNRVELTLRAMADRQRQSGPLR